MSAPTAKTLCPKKISPKRKRAGGAQAGAGLAHRTAAPSGYLAAGADTQLVLPLDSTFGCRDERMSAALVVIVDPDLETPGGPTALRKLYGLTGAEARVAAAALRGEGLRSIAEELAVSMNTARTHLQHVFDKTGTHRQAELVRVLTTVLSGTGQFDATASRGMRGTMPDLAGQPESDVRVTHDGADGFGV